ncbi:hypothetical protein D2E80_11900 [Mycobacteroides abscessus]|nr:hypothetical protein D2E80_11900 [Mycobacteroides abscessus]
MHDDVRWGHNADMGSPTIEKLVDAHWPAFELSQRQFRIRLIYINTATTPVDKNTTKSPDSSAVSHFFSRIASSVTFQN